MLDSRILQRKDKGRQHFEWLSFLMFSKTLFSAELAISVASIIEIFHWMIYADRCSHLPAKSSKKRHAFIPKKMPKIKYFWSECIKYWARIFPSEFMAEKIKMWFTLAENNMSLQNWFCSYRFRVEYSKYKINEFVNIKKSLQ